MNEFNINAINFPSWSSFTGMSTVVLEHGEVINSMFAFAEEALVEVASLANAVCGGELQSADTRSRLSTV